MAYGLPSDRDLEMLILSAFVRIERYGLDRRPQTGGEVDHATGLPMSEASLLPIDRATKGTELALTAVIKPLQMAQAMLSLVGKPSVEWSYDEKRACGHLEEKIRCVATRLAERGVLDPAPAAGPDGEPLPLGNDGTTRLFGITPAGLRHARERCRGTRYEERGPVSILDALPEDVARRAPDWARRDRTMKR